MLSVYPHREIIIAVQLLLGVNVEMCWLTMASNLRAKKLHLNKTDSVYKLMSLRQ